MLFQRVSKFCSFAQQVRKARLVGLSWTAYWLGRGSKTVLRFLPHIYCLLHACLRQPDLRLQQLEFSPPNTSQNWSSSANRLKQFFCHVAKQNKKKKIPLYFVHTLSYSGSSFLAGRKCADPSVGQSSLLLFTLSYLIPTANRDERGYWVFQIALRRNLQSTAVHKLFCYCTLGGVGWSLPVKQGK